jgi:hypothetical protein
MNVEPRIAAGDTAMSSPARCAVQRPPTAHPRAHVAITAPMPRSVIVSVAASGSASERNADGARR